MFRLRLRITPVSATAAMPHAEQPLPSRAPEDPGEGEGRDDVDRREPRWAHSQEPRLFGREGGGEVRGGDHEQVRRWPDDHLEDLEDHDDHGAGRNELEHQSLPQMSAASAGQNAA